MRTCFTLFHDIDDVISELRSQVGGAHRYHAHQRCTRCTHSRVGGTQSYHVVLCASHCRRHARSHVGECIMRASLHAVHMFPRGQGYHVLHVV